MKNFGKCIRGHSQGVPKIFRAPIYGAHCVVIFAIAQLSCSNFVVHKLLVSHTVGVCNECDGRVAILWTKPGCLGQGRHLHTLRRPPLVSPKFSHTQLGTGILPFGYKEGGCWANCLCN